MELELNELIKLKKEADKLIRNQLKKEIGISWDTTNNAYYVNLTFRGKKIIGKRFQNLDEAIAVRDQGLTLISEFSKLLESSDNSSTKKIYLGNLVAIYRRLNNITQKELAELVGISRAEVSLIEHGKRNISLIKAYRIARVFDKKVDDIFIFDSKNKNVDTEIAGKRFGKLVALYPTTKRSRHKAVYWHCRCDCGNEIDVIRSNLTLGHYVSCGCVNEENRKNFKKILKEIQRQNCVDGTNLLTHNQKISKNNSTGVKGVSPFYSKGVFQGYRAYITYQRKQYSGGVYPTIEEAAEARKKLEDKYFKQNNEDNQD